MTDNKAFYELLDKMDRLSLGEILMDKGNLSANGKMLMNANVLELSDRFDTCDYSEMLSFISRVTDGRCTFSNNGRFHNSLYHAVGNLMNQLPDAKKHQFELCMSGEWSLKDFKVDIDKFLNTNSSFCISHKMIKVVEYTILASLSDKCHVEYMNDVDQLLVYFEGLNSKDLIQLYNETLAQTNGVTIMQIRHVDSFFEGTRIYSYLTGNSSKINFSKVFGFLSSKNKFQDVINVVRSSPVSLVLMKQDEMLSQFAYYHYFEEKIDGFLHRTNVFSLKESTFNPSSRVSCTNQQKEIIKSTNISIGRIDINFEEKLNFEDFRLRFEDIINKLNLDDKYIYGMQTVILDGKLMTSDMYNALFVLRKHSGCIDFNHLCSEFFDLSYGDYCFLKEKLTCLAESSYSENCPICSHKNLKHLDLSVGIDVSCNSNFTEYYAKDVILEIMKSGIKNSEHRVYQSCFYDVDTKCKNKKMPHKILSSITNTRQVQESPLSITTLNLASSS